MGLDAVRCMYCSAVGFWGTWDPVCGLPRRQALVCAHGYPPEMPWRQLGRRYLSRRACSAWFGARAQTLHEILAARTVCVSPCHPPRRLAAGSVLSALEDEQLRCGLSQSMHACKRSAMPMSTA